MVWLERCGRRFEKGEWRTPGVANGIALEACVADPNDYIVLPVIDRVVHDY